MNWELGILYVKKEEKKEVCQKNQQKIPYDITVEEHE